MKGAWLPTTLPRGPTARGGLSDSVALSAGRTESGLGRPPAQQPLRHPWPALPISPLRAGEPQALACPARGDALTGAVLAEFLHYYFYLRKEKKIKGARRWPRAPAS